MLPAGNALVVLSRKFHIPPLKISGIKRRSGFSGMRQYMRPLKNAQFYSSSRKAKILTGGIHWVFRGLKFEPNAEIGQKGAFCKGLEAIHVACRVSEKPLQLAPQGHFLRGVYGSFYDAIKINYQHMRYMSIWNRWQSCKLLIKNHVVRSF